jgi:hypothetical protein
VERNTSPKCSLIRASHMIIFVVRYVVCMPLQIIKKKATAKRNMIWPQHVDKGKLNNCILRASVDTVTILLDTIAGHNNVLDPLYFGHLSCLLLQEICLRNMRNWAPLRSFFLNKTAMKVYGPSLTHKDDHFEENCIKLWRKRLKFWNPTDSSRCNQFTEKTASKLNEK